MRRGQRDGNSCHFPAARCPPGTPGSAWPAPVACASPAHRKPYGKATDSNARPTLLPRHSVPPQSGDSDRRTPKNSTHKFAKSAKLPVALLLAACSAACCSLQSLLAVNNPPKSPLLRPSGYSAVNLSPFQLFSISAFQHLSFSAFQHLSIFPFTGTGTPWVSAVPRQSCCHRIRNRLSSPAEYLPNRTGYP